MKGVSNLTKKFRKRHNKIYLSESNEIWEGGDVIRRCWALSNRKVLKITNTGRFISSCKKYKEIFEFVQFLTIKRQQNDGHNYLIQS